MHNFKQKLSAWLALFTSTGTLICCAIPSLIAVIAGGSAVLGLISTFPWLTTLVQYKLWFFVGAGFFISLSAVLIYRPKGQVACSITGGEGCEVAGRATRIIFNTTIVIYLTGLFFSYGLVPLMRLFGV